MSTEFKFPDVGEGLSEGKLVSWKVKEGDSIKVDQTLAEVETDKAVVEIPSPLSGIVSKLHYQEGDTMEVGNVMVTFDSGENSQISTTQNTKNTQNTQKKFIDTKEEKNVFKEEKIPQTTTEEIKEKTSEKISESKKETISKSSTILAMPNVRKLGKYHDIDLTKIYPTGNSGQITLDDIYNATNSKDTTILLTNQETQEKEKNSSSSITSILKPTIKEELKSTTHNEFSIHDTSHMGNLLNDSFATPKVRRYAREHHIDIHQVKSTSQHGLISEADIDIVAGITPLETKKETPTIKSIQKASKINVTKQDTIVPMTTTRKIIAFRMKESQTMVAAVTHVEEVDMTNIFNLRNKEKETFEKLGIKLTYLPFIVKAALGALEKFPYFNATLKEETIILKNDYHIGIAVDTPHGLIVPVIRDANNKSIIDISKEIFILAAQAREKKIAPKDIVGSTFTITSVGNLGGIAFTPIINYPQSAILGVAKIRDEPKIIDNKIFARKIMNLCLTFDHRIVDGADAARFTSLIKEYLEDPQRLFMERI